MRRRFSHGLLFGLSVVWPVLSALLLAIVGLGVVVGIVEHWRVGESLYFAFVTGLTIGYGDHTPKQPLARVLAIAIGMCGILLTGLVAAIAVKALDSIRNQDHASKGENGR
jgi:hypothetical protein